MENVKELYRYLKKKNKTEKFLEDFPQIQNKKDFQEYVYVLNDILEKLASKLNKMKKLKKRLTQQNNEFKQIEELQKKISDQDGEEEFDQNLQSPIAQQKKENQTKTTFQNELLNKKQKVLEEEIKEMKKDLQIQKQTLQKIKKNNETLKTELNIDKLKQKFSEQIKLGSQMKDKLLLISYLDETLDLGFKQTLKSNNLIFSQIIEEKIKENKILDNFAQLNKLKEQKQFKFSHFLNQQQNQNISMPKITIFQNQINNEDSLETNKISTTLYNRYTFFPLGLFNQFKQVSNIYFLMIAIFAVLPGISAINAYSAFLPVFYVVLFALIFDWYDDLKRYRSDRKINNKKVLVFRNRKKEIIKSKDIQIGDYLLIEENKRAFADLVLITYISTKGYCYVDTSNLDGEKTLKPKISILDRNINTDILLLSEQVEKNLFVENLELNYRENEDDLTSFNGQVHLNLKTEEKMTDSTIRLDINNFIPRSAKIRNTTHSIGLVIYVGENTKVMKNMQHRIFKKSSLEYNMNQYIWLILGILLCFLIFLATYNIIYQQSFNFEKVVLKFDKNDAIQYFIIIIAYMVLMNTILPISLIISLQITKLVQNAFFLTDITYQDPLTKKKSTINSVNLNDQLGQVEYILSDKTGTLTQNKMVSRFFQILSHQITLNSQFVTNNYSFQPFTLYSKDQKESIKFENQYDIDFFFLLLLNTCHDCFAKSNVGDGNTEDSYQTMKSSLEFEGPSPDEIALLNGTKDFCNFFMTGSDSNFVLIKENSKIYQIEKVFVFKFDSDRKMMSVIIRFQNKFFLFVKGADTAIQQKSVNDLNEQFLEGVDQFLEQGLRVMFMAMRLLSQEELSKFIEKVNQFEKNPSSTLEQIYQVKQEIENNLFLFGATAIEDKLQDGLKETIDILKVAGIKIWMITGDKQETAKTIAYSSGLFDRKYDATYLDEEKLQNILQQEIPQKSKKQIFRVFRWRKNKQKLLKIPIDLEIPPHIGALSPRLSLKVRGNKQSETNFNLLVTGSVLSLALESKNVQLFTKFLMKFNCVVFSRTNPKQKVKIVRLLKSEGIKTLAVGDGANDVNMIQEANVGIGIIGEEGRQAKNASDFAIPGFRHLKPLILKFGRISYYNNSTFILFFFYKNFLLTLPQFYFAFTSDFSFKNIYHDWYLSFYNLLYTAFPIPGTACANRDLDSTSKFYQKNLIYEAYVYFQGQKSKLFNLRKFLLWIFTATIESVFLFISLYFSLHPIYTDHHESTYQIFSFLYYTIIVFSQLIKIFLLTFRYAAINLFGIFLCLFIYFIYVVITDTDNFFGYYKIISKTFSVDMFWVYFFFFFLTYLFSSCLFYAFKRYVFPGIKDNIRNIQNIQHPELLVEKLEYWRECDLKNNLTNFILH